MSCAILSKDCSQSILTCAVIYWISFYHGHDCPLLNVTFNFNWMQKTKQLNFAYFLIRQRHCSEETGLVMLSLLQLLAGLKKTQVLGNRINFVHQAELYQGH